MKRLWRREVRYCIYTIGVGWIFPFLSSVRMWGFLTLTGNTKHAFQLQDWWKKLWRLRRFSSRSLGSGSFDPNSFANCRSRLTKKNRSFAHRIERHARSNFSMTNLVPVLKSGYNQLTDRQSGAEKFFNPKSLLSSTTNRSWNLRVLFFLTVILDCTPCLLKDAAGREV